MTAKIGAALSWARQQFAHTGVREPWERGRLVEAACDPGFDPEHNVLDAKIEGFLRSGATPPAVYPPLTDEVRAEMQRRASQVAALRLRADGELGRILAAEDLWHNPPMFETAAEYADGYRTASRQMDEAQRSYAAVRQELDAATAALNEIKRLSYERARTELQRRSGR